MVPTYLGKVKGSKAAFAFFEEFVIEEAQPWHVKLP
jgi:hypothetical protein